VDLSVREDSSTIVDHDGNILVADENLGTTAIFQGVIPQLADSLWGSASWKLAATKLATLPIPLRSRQVGNLPPRN
jgi:hypothetical protein